MPSVHSFNWERYVHSASVHVVLSSFQCRYLMVRLLYQCSVVVGIWNSIVGVPGHCLFIFTVKKICINKRFIQLLAKRNSVEISIIHRMSLCVLNFILTMLTVYHIH